MATSNADNTNIIVGANNEINYPSQPCFLAYLSSSALNVTGNNTNYTVICDSEVFDQGANYNPATGVFSAPVNGKYRFNCGVTISGIGTANSLNVVVTGTSRSFQAINLNPLVAQSSAGTVTFSGSCIIDLSATNTVTLVVTANGAGDDTVDINGQATNPLTWFSGTLVC